VAEALPTVHLLLAHSRGEMAEDTPAESKSPGEAPVDLAPIETEHSESSYRIYKSMAAVGSTA